MKYFQSRCFISILCISLFSISSISLSDDGEFVSLTPRFNIVGSSGKPTNDVLGLGLIGHYKYSDKWYLGVALDHSPEFDFERTASRVGLKQDSNVADIDAKGTLLQISAFAERRYPDDAGNIEYFWTLGAGISEIDMDDVSGPLQGGGNFEISTTTDTELVIVGSIGMQHRLSENWSGRYAFSIDHHFADWKLKDRVSGNTGSIDDYGIYGIRLGATYHF